MEKRGLPRIPGAVAHRAVRRWQVRKDITIPQLEFEEDLCCDCRFRRSQQCEQQVLIAAPAMAECHRLAVCTLGAKFVDGAASIVQVDTRRGHVADGSGRRIDRNASCCSGRIAR
jgi:hypothetical protein